MKIGQKILAYDHISNVKSSQQHCIIIADQLNICSLNCEGFKRCSDFISSFENSNNCDILCFQEVWLLQCNIKELSTVNDNYLYIGVSGVDDGEKIIQGHPLGGVAIFTRNLLVVLLPMLIPQIDVFAASA